MGNTFTVSYNVKSCKVDWDSYLISETYIQKEYDPTFKILKTRRWIRDILDDMFRCMSIGPNNTFTIDITSTSKYTRTDTLDNITEHILYMYTKQEEEGGGFLINLLPKRNLHFVLYFSDLDAIDHLVESLKTIGVILHMPLTTVETVYTGHKGVKYK